jgi:hypothetical protein
MATMQNIKAAIGENHWLRQASQSGEQGIGRADFFRKAWDRVRGHRQSQQKEDTV